jgi:hypothetical protein
MIPQACVETHVANISTVIQAADAQTILQAILNAASARMLRVSYGVM